MSNLPIYAAAIANEDVKLPGHADREALTYSEAIALDTDYEVPDTNTTDYVVDVFIWIGIIIVSVAVFLVLLYAIASCWICRKCRCGKWMTMKNEPFDHVPSSGSVLSAKRTSTGKFTRRRINANR